MDILFAITELSPYVKVGGLSDVAAALPKVLRALGHKVTLVVPRYPGFEAEGLLIARRLTPMPVEIGGKTVDVTLYDGRLPSQVDLVLVDAPGLYDRKEVYGERGEDYPDNALRFGLFSRAVAKVARARAESGAPFDVVHVHDWPTALVPAYLAKEGQNTKTVLTIHNLAYQGVFPHSTLASLGLDEADLPAGAAQGPLNMLRIGLEMASQLTTVSSNYGKEILTPEGGAGLHEVLRRRENKLSGILNGVDYAVWNPATDSVLASRYDAEDWSGKARCKGALQKELGLPIDAAAPLIASVGRFSAQKGTDLVAETIAPLMCSTDAQMVIVGTGEPGLIKAVETQVAKSNGRAVYTGGAPEDLVHRVFAGADVVLVPSRFEPCGLVQMYAQRYGALPVAHATGGLVDSIVDCDAQLETGTGFLFHEESALGLLGATQRALAARALPGWSRLVRRIMRLDRGWERAARHYERIYRT
jgi:starch synthase